MEWYKGNVWTYERRGLRKEVLGMNFSELDKPTEISTLIIQIEQVENLNGRPSKYLSNPENYGKDQELIMGTSLTPLDFCLELFVGQMILGETALCTMRTKKPGEVISYVVYLKKIVSSRLIAELSVKETYEYALKCKGFGVIMFKDYKSFAHEYFSKAALALISLRPIKSVKAVKEIDGFDRYEVKALFDQVRLNLAAIHLLEKRYEDVIFLTKFIEKDEQPSEKGIYRRATAFYNIKNYDKALQLLEKIPNFREIPEFVTLYKRIIESQKASNEHYKDIVKRMFH